MALCHTTKGERILTFACEFYSLPRNIDILLLLIFMLTCSEFESDYGCRGAISLDKATIKVFEELLTITQNILQLTQCDGRLALYFENLNRVTSLMSADSMWQLTIAFGICELKIQRIKCIGLMYYNHIKFQLALT